MALEDMIGHEITRGTYRGADFSIDWCAFGEGPRPLIILPGLSVKSVLESAEAIEAAFHSFGIAFTVYVFDRMKPVSPGITIEGLADAQAEAMTELGLDYADIFGASQGGMMALVIQLKHPELVRRLYLGSTTDYVSPEMSARLKCWADLAAAGDRRGLARAFSNMVYCEDTLRALGDAAEHMLDAASDEELSRFVTMAHACDGFDLREEVRREVARGNHFRAYITGSREDRVLDRNSLTELAKDMDLPPLRIYEGYGYAVYDEAPDYRGHMQEWLENSV